MRDGGDPAGAVLARVPSVQQSHRECLAAALGDGLVDRALKDLCVRRVLGEETAGSTEGERAALAWADAIVAGDDTDDALWAQLRGSFTEAQLVELGYALGFVFGQRRWLATLGM